MTQSEKAQAFLQSLDPETLKVGDGADGLPVWIGIDAEAEKVYKVYASGLAQGFGDGRMMIINGLPMAEWRVARGEQVAMGKHVALSGEKGLTMFEIEPGPQVRSAPQPAPAPGTPVPASPSWEV